MKKNKRGFTPIELLVVVLIIGILAAVAVPQYNKAVLRSRLVEIQSFLNTAEKAAELYILENGYPTSNKNLGNGLNEELNFDFSSFGPIPYGMVTPAHGQWTAGINLWDYGVVSINVITSASHMGGQVQIYEQYSQNGITKTCGYYSAEDKGKEICDMFVSGKSGWNVFLGS